MARKTLVLFTLSLFAISLLAVSAFGASAAKVDQVPTEAPGLIPISELAPLAVDGADTYVGSGSEYGGNYTDLGFPTFGADYVYPAHQVGNTFYDYQANGSMGRQIVVGSDGRVSFVWMNDEDAHPGGVDRSVSYNSWLAGSFQGELTLRDEGAGYTSVDAYADKACPTYHQGGDSWASIQLSSASTIFNAVAVPQANCQGIATMGGAEAEYLWPVIDVQVGPSGDTIVHMVASEAAPTGEIQSIVYWRGTGTPYTTWDDPTCGEFVDSCNDISAIVRAGKDGATPLGNVAIVYTRPRNFEGASTTQYDNDVAYHVSNDYGVTWNGLQYAVNYADADLERAYTDVSALWDSRGCLHIVWQAAYYNDAEGTIHLQWANLYHWAGECSEITTPAISLVASAYNAQNCLPGAWNRNISKMNISECIGLIDGTAGVDTNIYVTYTYFRGDIDGDPEVEDCSAASWSNGEIYAQTSSTWGDTWGAPTNLTNTKSPGCAAGACESEHWSSSAMYVTDSLRISFIADVDAGGVIQTEGSWQQNPVMFMSVPCFEMEEYVSLSALPSDFCYPYGGNPGSSYQREFTLTNAGNITATYTITPSAGWLSTNDPGSGSIGVGPANALDFTLTVVAPSPEGLYNGTITFNYNDGIGPATTVINVDFYSFSGFAAPEDAAIRTSLSRLNVANLGRVGHQESGDQMSYFVAGDDPLNYLYDGSLIIGSDSEGDVWASWIVFYQDVYCGGVAPGPNEDHGLLWPLTPIVDDSTTYGSYRYAEGSGCNEDSTVAFDCEYYAPKHPDSADFYIGRFDFYPGPKFTTDINDVFIAFATDFDVPSDTGSDNTSGVDETLQLVYQKGEYPASVDDNDNRYAGMSYFGDDGVDALGAIVLENDLYVYPHGDYPVDTLNDLCLGHNAWTASHADSIEDLNSILFAKRGVTISNDTTHSFVIIFAGSNNSDAKNLNHLKAQIPKARKFICDHVASDYIDCQFATCLVGDADGNGIHEITDAVYLVSYVFVPGAPAPTPNPIASGDPDCTGIVEITDAVFMVSYVFVPGSPPPGDPNNDGTPDCDCTYTP